MATLFVSDLHLDNNRPEVINYFLNYLKSLTTDIESLYIKMKNKNYRVSRATLYNTIELLLDCGLVRKHQFGKNQAQYEKCYFDHQHDHFIDTDSGEVKEFCDPRIQMIKKSIEEVFEVNIHNHSLYFYATKNNSKN